MDIAAECRSRFMDTMTWSKGILVRDWKLKNTSSIDMYAVYAVRF